MSDVNVVRALDTIDNLSLELRHIQNLLELLGIGFAHNPFGSKDYKVAATYILGKYIERIHNEYIKSVKGNPFVLECLFFISRPKIPKIFGYAPKPTPKAIAQIAQTLRKVINIHVSCG